MKKRLLAGIMTAVLGVLAVAPVTGFADEFKPVDFNILGDVNLDGKLDLSDYTALKYAVNNDGRFENGKFVDFVRGDFNNDGEVDKSDLQIMREYVGSDNYVAEADFNHDGVVDTLDYTVLQATVRQNGQIREDGTVQPYITGDMDQNGRFEKDDLFILGKLI